MVSVRGGESLEEQCVSAAEATRRTGHSERTIRRETLRGTLKARKHGSTFQIADLDHFVASRSPDVHTLLARVLALEDLEDVQPSQAQRLSDLERQVFRLQAQRLSNAPSGVANLLDERFPILAHPLALAALLLSSAGALSSLLTTLTAHWPWLAHPDPAQPSSLFLHWVAASPTPTVLSAPSAPLPSHALSPLAAPWYHPTPGTSPPWPVLAPSVPLPATTVNFSFRSQETLRSFHICSVQV